jgi:hypothetical protein
MEGWKDGLDLEESNPFELWENKRFELEQNKTAE